MHRPVLENAISHFISLSDDEFELFYSQLTFRIVKRKEFLLNIGNVCKESFFIVNGLIRYYHLIDGEEVTGQFFFEGSWYSDYESFLLGTTSTQYIQALEKSEVAVLSKTVLQKLYIEIPKFEKFGRLMAENAFIGLRKRTEIYTHLTPEERYLKLIQQRPKVIERVPQHYIASYLGMKPQSLSRIRKRISKDLP